MRPSLLINASQLIILSFCVFSTSSSRSKRQISFENNNNRQSGSDCITPLRERGQCIRWTTCSPLNRITRWDRVRPYTCGFAGNEPRVCCPLPPVDDQEPPPRTTPPPSRRTTPPPSRRTEPPTRRDPVTRRPGTTTPRTPVTGTGRMGNVTRQRPSFLPRRCGIPSDPSTDSRVIGGREADPGAWPWMAVVFVQKRNGALSADCGGALVTNRIVLTAAHCVVSGRASTLMSPRLLSVRLGAHDLRIQNETGSVQVGVDAVRRHEQFDPRTYKNDIAILRLSRPVNFTNRIQPVCLPYDVDFSQSALTGKTSTVTGFGTTRFNGESSDVLMEVTFDIQSQETCRRSYVREVNITMEYLCAGIEDGTKDSCQGDSGGPLVTIKPGGDEYYLVGIVSFGKLCGQPNYPGVYTRVTRYLNWLTTNIQELLREN